MIFSDKGPRRLRVKKAPKRGMMGFTLVASLFGLGCAGGEDEEVSTSTTAIQEIDPEWPGELDEGNSENADVDGVFEGCEIPCSTWKDECPPHYKCTPVACIPKENTWDGQFCRRLIGSRKRGESCTKDPVFGRDDCDRGLMCWATDAEGKGVCVELCSGRPDFASCSAMHEVCMIANDQTLPLCLPRCDPLSADCFDHRQLCIQLEKLNTFVCVPDASGTQGEHGDLCYCANCCDPGHACVAAGRVDSPSCDRMSCCAELCSLSQSQSESPCPGLLETCEPVFADESSEHADVGWCIVRNNRRD